MGGARGMSEAVIVALTTGGLSLIGTIITVVATNRSTTKELFAQLDKHQAVTDTKIDALAEKVAKHNNLIERTYQLEKEMDLTKARIDGIELRDHHE